MSKENDSNNMLCAICESNLFNNPLLVYSNMPSSAQGFPTLENLDNDVGETLKIYQCANCGLVQLKNKPVDYFREVIRAAAFSDEMKSFRYNQFKSWVNDYNLLGKKILEVGCGRGEYLNIFKEIGLNAYGIEYSYKSVQYCNDNSLSVHQGYLGDDKRYRDSRGPFQAFASLNFMEHWPDPNASLQILKKNLTEEAIGLVEVPNFDMILAKGLFSEFISDHLFYFTKDSLTFTLQKNGFEIIECKSVWYDYILSAVVKNRTAYNLSSLKTKQEKIVNELHSFIAKFPKNKVAVWGAGHQALALLSLGNLSMLIPYIIDSATFKQGKFTPGTHIPIFSPDELTKSPVDAIIVMAASYSDEVAKQIKNNYGKTINIKILRNNGLESFDD